MERHQERGAISERVIKCFLRQSISSNVISNRPLQHRKNNE